MTLRAARSSSCREEKAMPIESIIVSVLIVTVFSTFAIVLAYAEYQTRHLKREPDDVGILREAEDHWQEAA